MANLKMNENKKTHETVSQKCRMSTSLANATTGI